MTTHLTNKRSGTQPRPGSFYMPPPVWSTQDQQVAAPRRVRGKGRSQLGMGVLQGSDSPDIYRGKQEQMRVRRKASQGAQRRRDRASDPQGAAMANALVPSAARVSQLAFHGACCGLFFPPLWEND